MKDQLGLFHRPPGPPKGHFDPHSSSFDATAVPLFGFCPNLADETHQPVTAPLTSASIESLQVPE